MQLDYRIGQDIAKYLSREIREYEWDEIVPHIEKGGHIICTIKVEVYGKQTTTYSLFAEGGNKLPPNLKAEYKAQRALEVLWMECDGLYVDRFQHRVDDTYRWKLERVK